MVIEVGAVVKCFTDTTDPPKQKRKVLVCIDRQSSTLLINSDLTAFARKTPNICKDNLLLSSADHGFLEHDSYLDCSEIHLLNTAACKRQLDNGAAELLGHCPPALIREIIKTIEASTNLSDKFRLPAVESLTRRLRELENVIEV